MGTYVLTFIEDDVFVDFVREDVRVVLFTHASNRFHIIASEDVP